MSEDKKPIINLVPKSIDKAVKNITNKPTQNIGTTLADIWYLVFGSISQTAEKRKLKYSYALKEFEKELQDKINQIPEDKLIEPDIQIVAPALESTKYCVEKEELRKMFSNLISKSINKETYLLVHPIFINIIPQITPLDAKLLNNIYQNSNDTSLIIDIDDECLLFSLSALEHQGLIRTDIENKLITRRLIAIEQSYIPYMTESDSKSKTIQISMTELGKSFCKICIEK